MQVKHFHTVTSMHLQRDGSIAARPVGKFFDDGRTVAVLEDHHGLLSDLPHEGPVTPEVRRVLERMRASTHLRVDAKEDDPEQASPGAPPTEEGPPEEPAYTPSRPASVFDYHRAGMEKPHTVEFHNGIGHLDGSPLTHEQSSLILSNVRNGIASLRYRQPPPPPPVQAPGLTKMEAYMVELSKAEGAGGGLANHMETMRQLVAAGHLPPETYDRIRRELFSDDMTGLGNKRAYHEHLERGTPGVHVMLDSNGLKAMNDTLGHEAGDHAIRATGQALRSAIDKTVGSEQAKAWRLGGDEFGFHVPSHEHAGQVLRQFRHELEAVPPIGGTHPLSVSCGIGPDPATADKALYKAKGQKLDAIAASGRDPGDRMQQAPHTMYAHSLHPGHEGPVPISDPSPLNEIMKKPPAPAAPTAAEQVVKPEGAA